MAQKQSVDAARAEQRNVLGVVARQGSAKDPAIMARSKELKNHNAKACAQINSAIGAVVG